MRARVGMRLRLRLRLRACWSARSSSLEAASSAIPLEATPGRYREI